MTKTLNSDTFVGDLALAGDNKLVLSTSLSSAQPLIDITIRLIELNPNMILLSEHHENHVQNHAVVLNTPTVKALMVRIFVKNTAAAIPGLMCTLDIAVGSGDSRRADKINLVKDLDGNQDEIFFSYTYFLHQ
jgi:hypothetical protein